MLKVHHLILSRSERIVWFVEELGVPYELVKHTRNAETFRSPDSLWKVSPMGKAPVIHDDGVVVAESGAIVEYLCDRYDGQNRLRPAKGTKEYLAYQHWLHAAESTLMVPVLTDLLCILTQTESPALKGFIDGEYATTLEYLNDTLAEGPFVAGKQFTGADVMVGYTLHLANGTSIPTMKTSAPIGDHPHVVEYLKRLEARPAFEKMRELCAA